MNPGHVDEGFVMVFDGFRRAFGGLVAHVPNPPMRYKSSVCNAGLLREVPLKVIGGHLGGKATNENPRGLHCTGVERTDRANRWEWKRLETVGFAPSSREFQ